MAMSGEEKKAYNKRYYETNREKVKAARKHYRENNPEKAKAAKKAFSKRYRAANPEKARAHVKRWSEANPEKRRAREARRRAAKAGVVHVPYVDAEVFDRDDWYCQACGVKTNRDTPYKVNLLYPTVDHIIPIDKQGHDALYNLQTLCSRCNSSKRAKDNDEFMKEFA